MYDWQLGSEKAVEAALWADLLVFHRPANEDWYKFIKLMQKYGKLFVSDYDDNPFKTSPFNQYYAVIGVEPIKYEWEDGSTEWLWHEDMVSPSGKKIFDIERNINFRETFRLNFKKSDMVTCTTPELAEEFKQINPNTKVLPNLITPEWFPLIPEWSKKEIRVCWQGGSSHYEDLFFIHPIIEKMLKTYDNVKFVFFGDMRFKNLFKDCDQSKIEWHDWVGHDTYPYALGLLNCDIGLCPLVDNEFNRMKSAIKWMEYSMVGMTTIASDIPPYNKVIVDGETGVLCKEDEKDWLDKLDRLIKDKSYRTTLAKKAKDEVLTNHNMNTKAHLWIDAYSEILKPKSVVLK